MRPAIARQIEQVVKNASIFRRLPTQTFDCDPEMFQFLVRNPEVVVGIWDEMGMTQLKMSRRGPYSYVAADGIGTTSQFQLVYGTPQIHVFLGNGVYEGNLIRRPVKGQSVVLLRSVYRKSTTGRPMVTAVLDVFVRIENGAIDLAAKTLYPLFIKTADENYVIASKFIGQVSYAAEVNEKGLCRLAEQLTHVDSEVRQKFETAIHRVHGKSQQRGNQISDASQSKMAVKPSASARPTRNF